MPSASAELSTSCCLLSEPVLGPRTGAAGDRPLDDGLVAATGIPVASVDAGAASGSAASVAGTPEPTSATEPNALDCAPPLLCASPLRGSVTVDPIDVVAVVPVELVDAGAEAGVVDSSVDGDVVSLARPTGAPGLLGPVGTSAVGTSPAAAVSLVGVADVCGPPVLIAVPGGALRTVESVDVDELGFDLGVGPDWSAGVKLLLVCLRPVIGPSAVFDNVPGEDAV